MSEFNWSQRVYYEDTDAGGVVYHANYLKFMERARTEWLRHLSFEQTYLKEQYQLIFVVRQITMDYLKPARFNDLLQITTQVHKKGKVSMTLHQQIWRETEVLCTALVKVATVNSATFALQPFPSSLLKALESL
jgi:acyl-CoA thioester hydrolase